MSRMRKGERRSEVPLDVLEWVCNKVEEASHRLDFLGHPPHIYNDELLPWLLINSMESVLRTIMISEARHDRGKGLDIYERTTLSERI
jgi:hypothetical protein